MTVTAPAPLLTILSPTRYPFAVAHVVNGQIIGTVGTATTLADCYAQVQGWRSYVPHETWIMAEMQQIGEHTYWCAV